jgi:hypothetical protein
MITVLTRRAGGGNLGLAAEPSAMAPSIRTNSKEKNMLRHLLRQNDTKIIMLILDGLGGIRNEEFPATALEAAATPNLDSLAAGGACGGSLPIGAGITPGSGPAHFALFGYDPLAPENDVGYSVTIPSPPKTTWAGESSR